MLWGAANRDPAVFPDPEVFNLKRPMRGDATFGGGAHICPGRGIARRLTEVTLDALAHPEIELALTNGPYLWLERSTMRQLERMPVVLRRRAI
jgi:cytochrome P450